MSISPAAGSKSPVAVVQVMDSLGEGRGGLTKAVFERFSLLSQNSDSVLITNAFQVNSQDIFNRLQSSGVIPEHTVHKNFHRSLHENISIRGKRAKPLLHSLKKSADTTTTESFGKRSITRYFSEGRFLGLELTNDQGRWQQTEVHGENTPWLLSAREYSSTSGAVSLREYYDENQKPRYRIYYNQKGIPYAQTWVTPAGYEYRTVTSLFSGKPEIYKDMKQLNALWLEKEISAMPNVALFADEPRTNYAFKHKTENVKRYAPIHADHRVNSTSSEIKPWVKDYTTNAKNIDTFLFFTVQQANLFAKDTGVPSSQITVIPHAIDLSLAEHNVQRAEPSFPVFTSIGRLAPEKRIEDIISAFAVVHQTKSDAILRIYGDGPSLSHLKQQVEKLGLATSVFFPGRTENSVASFAEADLSILTSKSEGFGLVILESFLAGTPVISYEVPYGPNELIQHEYNGLHVADGDINGLAEAMLRACTPELQVELSDGARKTVQAFSKPAWAAAWQALLS